MKNKYLVAIALMSSQAISVVGPEKDIADNKTAALQPTKTHFFNAGMMFDWEANRLYQVYTKPERITDIAFEIGETILSIGGGDSQRWTISETQRQRYLLTKAYLC